MPRLSSTSFQYTWHCFLTNGCSSPSIFLWHLPEKVLSLLSVLFQKCMINTRSHHCEWKYCWKNFWWIFIIHHDVSRIPQPQAGLWPYGKKTPSLPSRKHNFLGILWGNIIIVRTDHMGCRDWFFVHRLRTWKWSFSSLIYPPKISKNGDLPEQNVSLPEGKPDEWGKIHNVHGTPIPSGLRCRSPCSPNFALDWSQNRYSSCCRTPWKMWRSKLF